MYSSVEKNNATHCAGGIQSNQSIVLDNRYGSSGKLQGQQQNIQILTIEDQAREFMIQHSIRFDGAFIETGSIPIQFAGYESIGETRGKNLDKTERLFCSHFDDSNRQGLRITFRSWHFSWGDQWITKTFWTNTGNFSENDLQEFTRKRRERKEQDRKRLEEEKNKSDQLADWCLELYSRASKEGVSPYIKRKKLKFIENVRYQTELNSDTGEQESRILIPLYNFSNELRALQIIYPNKCLFKPDDQKPRDKHFINKHSRCFFILGILQDGKEIRVCEGFSTASTVFELTGSATLAAMSRSNLKTVCEQLKERYKNSEIIICADNDLQTPGNPGLKDALDSCKSLDIKVVYPIFPDPELAKNNKWNDFNDLYVHVENGPDIAKKQLKELFSWQMLKATIIKENSSCDDKKVLEEEWPDPKPIQAALYPVSSFEPDILLPEILKDWVMDEADRMPCPPDFIAVAAIIALGTIVGSRCVIKPKSLDDWIIVPNLWGGIVGLPSAKKSPAISAALKPLDSLVSRATEIFQKEMEVFEVEKTIFEAKKEALGSHIKSEMKSEIKKPKSQSKLDELTEKLLSQRQETPNAPNLRRYKSNDTTIEKLGELLRDNPTGMLVLRDELVGLIASWDRDGREGERTFYLEGWNGYGSFDTDRIKRGTIFIPNLCISIFGGIQPDKLIVYLEQASKALSNDGLLQRFQMLVYPDYQAWEWRDRAPNKKVRHDVFTLFEVISSFDPVDFGATPKDTFTNFPFFNFDDAAQKIFIEWSGDLHLRKMPKEDNPLIQQHLAKYDKLFPALALLFHLVDCVQIGQQNWGPVKAASATKAAAWCEYLESHARRCYGLLADEGLRAAQSLTSKIAEGKISNNFTARDVRRNQWRNLTTDEAVKAAIDWLEDEGWLQSYKVGGTGPGSGQPTTRYTINPKVLALNENEKTA